ncbi:MAG TPA: AGE family epimerase/isomerase [Acetobacteraceae bacterium]
MTDVGGAGVTGGVSVTEAGFAGIHDVASAHAAFRGWMFGHALPFWAGAGNDAPGLGVHESLQLDGSPSGVPFKRMRVQARQVYVFSHAALLGWAPGRAVAEDAYAFMARQGARSDGAWARRLSPAGDMLDPAADLYDLAFVLFALAWHARLTRSEEPLARARRTLDWIAAHMPHPPAGYRNVLPWEDGPRQQNPHMHLLEAVLALYETSGDAHYADHAHALVGLFRRHLFNPATGTLGEFFAEDWTPAPGDAGTHVEPGHQLEWVWLLDQYARLTGGEAGAEASRLYSFALRHGVDPATGLVWDVIGRDGAPRLRSFRLWPQTEALKAHVAMARRGGDALARVAPTVRGIGTRYLQGCLPGAWTDQLDETGARLSRLIPTSSFYHVFMGYAELDGLALRLNASSNRPASVL